VTGERVLDGRRVLVVGASSGIGRATALASVRAGAAVALAARSEEQLAAAAAQAGPAATVVVADVTVPDDCRRLVDEAVAALGGLDVVVYASAATHLQAIEDVDAPTWHRLFATNTVGLSLVLAAALPHLVRSPSGRVLVLTSDSVGHPFPGLGAYVATKAALESVTESWRVEHPELAVCLVTAGPTATDAAAAWDPTALGRYFDRWIEGSYVRADVVPAQPDDVGRQLVDILAGEPFAARVDLAPPRPWER
jgi:NAD(P)-dependent dehydrogenase (short-subunit alcohol dehydrogenase family)